MTCNSQALAFVLFFSLFSSACSKSVNEEQCGQLLDRYTDKVIDQARPSTKAAERLELQQAARKKAKLDPAFSQCSARVNQEQFDCAMAAGNADQIERCLM